MGSSYNISKSIKAFLGLVLIGMFIWVFSDIMNSMELKTPKIERISIEQEIKQFENSIGDVILLDLRDVSTKDEIYYQLDTETFIDNKLVSSMSNFGTFKEIDSLKCKRYKEAKLLADRLIYLNKKKCN